MNWIAARYGKLVFLILPVVIILSGCNASVPREMEPGITDTPTVVDSPIISPSVTPTEIVEESAQVGLSSGPFKEVLQLDEILTDEVESLISTSDGSIWLFTRQEILKIDETGSLIFLEHYSGKFVGVDTSMRVWVVSEGFEQISAWDGKIWTNYGAEDGWTALDVNYYMEVYTGQGNAQGEFWLATSQDVRFFDGQQWAVFTRKDIGMEPPVYEDLMVNFLVNLFASGTVWVGECDWGGPGPFGGGGLRWFEDGEWRGESSPAGSGCVNALIEDPAGQVWVGVDSILWRYDPTTGDWREFATPESPVEGTRIGFIESLTADPTDGIWAVFDLCGGASCFVDEVLYHLRDDQWHQVGMAEEYTGVDCGPAFDGNGVPWLFREEGVFRVKEDIPGFVSPLAAHFGVADESGRIWIVAAHEDRDILWVHGEETTN